MARCNQGHPFCEDCLNCGNEAGECDDCDDGSNFEPMDQAAELTVHDLKFIRFKEAA